MYALRQGIQRHRPVFGGITWVQKLVDDFGLVTIENGVGVATSGTVG